MARERVPATERLHRLRLKIEASLLQESLSAFAKACWHILEPATDLKWGWALEAVCQHLEAVTTGDITRLLINIPPGCAKSLITSVIWPAWEWTTRPHTRYLSTSHTERLTLRDSARFKRLVQSEWYQARWPSTVLTKTADSRIENIKTGVRESSPFSSLTGSRGDRVIIDDPMSVEDGNSIAAIEAAERIFLETVPTRVANDRSAIIVIMQRLNEKDTSGLIISRKLGYCHLMLPMRFEKERRCVTSIGFRDPRTEAGELLFPERFGEKTVSELERTLGSFASAGQLQQRPSPRGGGVFKTEHLQLWPHARPLPDFEFVIQSYDTAFTEKTHNDPTACTVWGVFSRGGCRHALLLDAWDEHLTYPTLRQRMIDDWHATYGGRPNDPASKPRRADAILVENKGSGIALLQELRRAGVPVLTYNPGKADKFGRASQALPMYEMGLFYVMESASSPGDWIKWARPFIDQLTRWGPGVSGHDDYVDTFSQTAIYLRDNNLLELSVSEDDDSYPLSQDRRENPYAQ